MKKVINGKLYNTDTAADLAVYEANATDSLNYYSERLYRKRTGEYFIHGEGGARTRYAAATSDGWSRGGEVIFPLSVDEARAWAEEHLPGDEFERIFGAVPEDGAVVKTSFDLAPELAAKLQDVATERGVSRRAIIEELIRSL